MIFESASYKRELLRLVSKFERWHRDDAWSDCRVAAFERDVFVAFFLIRKLVESRKLTSSLRKLPIRVSLLKPTGKPVTPISRFDWWELYELSGPTRSTRGLEFLCNQVIHSYVFGLLPEGKRGTAIVVSSDRHKGRGAFKLGYRTILMVLRRVGSDDPRSLHVRREVPNWFVELM